MLNYYKNKINNPDNIMTLITKRVIDYDMEHGYYSQIFSDNLFKDVFGKYYSSEYSHYPFNYLGKDIYFPEYSTLIHPKLKESCVKIRYEFSHPITEIPHMSGYTPIACIIYVKSKTVKEFHHVICGYICNNVKMIYDSGNNYIGEHDWTSYDDMHNLKIIIDINNYYHFVSYTTIYYVKKDMIYDLEQTTFCPE
jgi:hypothetical protein